VQQILKNLLSNAFKFTDRGSVTLRIGTIVDPSRLDGESLREAGRVLAFEVADTGIGIPGDKQRIVFEAFQQADGTTSRKYGGTGLGLSISREIARLLGGEIGVVSAPGRGSAFTLFLPDSYEDAGDAVGLRGPDSETSKAGTPSSTPTPSRQSTHDPAPAAESSASRPIEDDRLTIAPADRVLLIVEDDEHFARILMAIAHQQGFKVVIATRGDIGLALALELRPSAIALDLQLPVHDGWTILDHLKRNAVTRHIPVQVISVLERDVRGAMVGAFAYLEKPVTKDALDGAFAHLRSFVDRTIRRLLLVENDEREREAISRSIAELGDIEIVTASSAEEARAELAQRPFDCMLVDLVLPGLDGVDLIAEVKGRDQFKDLPIVVYTGKDLSIEEERKFKRFASSVVVRGGLGSLDKLATDVGLFLHRAVPGAQSSANGGLDQKTVLIADDDPRNIFALSSALEAAGLRVLFADGGRAAIDALRSHDDVDLVLMDLMMPGMDGYETIRAIRELPQYAALPIVALTAKALAEDREKCLAAGASDYLAKPVDISTLLESVRRWTGGPPGVAQVVE
jgi:CheY-like chemotaxis protein